MLTAIIDAKAHPSVEPNPSFLFGKGSAGISANIPNSTNHAQASPVRPDTSAIIPPAPQSLQSAPPIPPVLPAMPDFVNEASSEAKTNKKSALFESIRNFGKGVFRKVKRESKPKVVSSDGGDLMSQLHNTFERRRNGISGDSSSTKPKKVVKQAPQLTADEQARKKAENLAKAATIREQNKKKWAEVARKNEEIARERRRVEAEVVKARIEQKAKEGGENREGVVMGIDPALHHNIVQI